MKRFIIPLVTVAVVASLIFAGCARPAPTPTPAPAPEEAETAADVPELQEYIEKGLIDPDMPMNPYAGLCIKPDGSPFRFAIVYLFTRVDWTTNQYGFLKSYLERGGAEATHFDPDADIEKQVDFIEDQITVGRPDGILIHAVEEFSVAPVLDKAIESGIPCFGMDFIIPSENPVPCGYHDFDGVKGSNVVGEFFAKTAEEKGVQINIFEVWGEMATTSAQNRHTGFHAVVDQSPLITVIESGNSHWSDEIAFDFVTDAFTAHPELNGVYVHGGGSTGTVEAIRAMGKLVPPDDPKHVYVATNDIDAVVVEAIDEGIMDGAGSHGSWDICDVGLKLMLTGVVLGQPVPAEVAVPMYFVTKERMWTPEGTLGGCPIYPLMPPGQWDTWPVLDWSTPGSLLVTPQNEPWQMETPTVELRNQYQGY